jgi:hypothetical protein
MAISTPLFLRKLLSWHPQRALAMLCLAAALPLLTSCNNTYNCSSPHCYGRVDWENLKPAAVSLEATVKLMPMNGGDGFVDDEIWMVDSGNANCGNYGMCWLELGALAGPAWFSDDATHLFWAENRPAAGGNSAGFFFHPLATPSGNELNSHVDYVITRDARPVSGDGWIIAATTSANQYVATTNNALNSPTRVQIGQELYGTSGASAPIVDFDATAVGTSTTVWDNVEVSTDGGIESDSPPIGYWQLSPSAGAGGIFITRCCQ